MVFAIYLTVRLDAAEGGSGRYSQLSRRMSGYRVSRLSGVDGLSRFIESVKGDIYAIRRNP